MWGGTFGHLYTAAEELNREGVPVALAQFRYINPLPANTGEILRRYKRVVVAELNTGQFADWRDRSIWPRFSHPFQGRRDGG